MSKRCRKHWWRREKIRFITPADLSPGAINIRRFDSWVELCFYCHKIRNIRK